MNEYIEVHPKNMKVGESYYFIPTWGHDGFQTEEQKERRFMDNARNAPLSKVLGIHENKYDGSYAVWHLYDSQDAISGKSYETTCVSVISPASTSRAYVKKNYKHVCKRVCHWCGQRLTTDMAN